jgi:ABC-2 type transport system ATP-binding protein
MITVNHLTKFYHGKDLGIMDVSFNIKKGEIFGFIGPNGAGKSTTVRTLLNLIFPTDGKASINNLDIVKDTVKIREIVGYIPSEVHFYEDMTVEAFLDYAGRISKKKFKKKQLNLIKKLELDVTRPLSDLSFGNKKKVAIVQALQSSPKVLILDEPTSGLDPLMQNTFFQLIQEERNNGTTIFFSSHILSEVQRICDRVGIIKNGKLIKVESIEDIMKTKAKKVRVKTNKELVPSNTIKNVTFENGYTSFMYTGNSKDLLVILQQLDVSDLTISEPTLEEIFIHYYEKGDD